MYNDGPGYFRVNNLQFAGGNATAAAVGITGPVMATAEFHFNNGGVRPIQVANNLTLNNGTVVDTTTDSPTIGLTVPSRRSRLNLGVGRGTDSHGRRAAKLGIDRRRFRHQSNS